MIYSIKYGEISKKWAHTWESEDKSRDPHEVLETEHEIVFTKYGSWIGFIHWAEEHCSDSIRVDWGSLAWKCKGKVLINLSREKPGSVPDVDLVDPEKTYGVVYTEIF